jgi:hypothetical protein
MRTTTCSQNDHQEPSWSVSWQSRLFVIYFAVSEEEPEAQEEQDDGMSNDDPPNEDAEDM